MRRLSAGELPTFPSESAAIRAGDWTITDSGDLDANATHRLNGLEHFADMPDPGGDSIVVIDTVFAAFELEEILYRLRRFRAGVEPSPIGYLFNFIKLFHDRAECILPDRADITVSTPCVNAYLQHLASVCNRRGARLLGDYPDLAHNRFAMDRPIEAADLLQVPRGRITERGARDNIRFALRFLTGDATIPNIDAEFARAQLWQWVHHETGVLDSGRIISGDLFLDWLQNEQDSLASDANVVPAERLDAAARYLSSVTLSEIFVASLDAETYPPAP